jgi:hypothetical protein
MHGLLKERAVNQTILSAVSLEGNGNGGLFSIAGESTPQGNFEITVFVDKYHHKVSFTDKDEKEITTATKKLTRFLRNTCGEVVGQSRSDSNCFLLKFIPLEKQLQQLIDAIREVLQMECHTLIITFTYKGDTYSFSGKFDYVSGLYSQSGHYELGERWTYLGKDPSPEQYETIGCLDGVRSTDLVPLHNMPDIHAFDIHIRHGQLDETLSEVIATLAK